MIGHAGVHVLRASHRNLMLDMYCVASMPQSHSYVRSAATGVAVSAPESCSSAGPPESMRQHVPPLDPPLSPWPRHM